MGDDAFGDFYQANYGRTLAVVAGIVGDRAEAEDLTQEAFARALLRWPRISGYDLPEAWVRRVAIRLATDSLRRVRRAIRAAVRMSAQPLASAAPGEPLAATDLGEALRRLPLRQREILVLRYLADLPVEAIAAERGLPVSTVKTRLTAARRRLEAELAITGTPEVVRDER